MNTIIGAGLAGLLAAHAWPTAMVYEAEGAPRAQHRALLRFRSDAVARLTGIDFRPVIVRKAIWLKGKFVAPSIQLANLYSQKVIGRIASDRSIWSLEPAERWIAPESLYDQLIEAIYARIVWGKAYPFGNRAESSPIARLDFEPIVNTAPLPVVLKDLRRIVPPPTLQRSGISVSRWRIPRCDAYQTIYFPIQDSPVYRASITGDLLIVEAIHGISMNDVFMEPVARAFGIQLDSLVKIDAVQQEYGKIVPLPDAERKALLNELTTDYGIFSLGRFATWRNILLDDVVQDIAVIRRLLKVSRYDLRRHAS